MIINLRGTGGSGKSTVVRRVMELYERKIRLTAPLRRQPLGYTLQDQKWGRLFVPGHYEIACGGCDTLKTVDQVYDLVRSYAFSSPPLDVLYEGIMVQDDVRRAVALDTQLKHNVSVYGIEPQEGDRLHVILLNTPIEECLAAVRDRRNARGDTRPFNEKNTRSRYEGQLRIRDRLKAAGVSVERLNREEAYQRVCELLRIRRGRIG